MYAKPLLCIDTQSFYRHRTLVINPYKFHANDEEVIGSPFKKFFVKKTSLTDIYAMFLSAGLVYLASDKG